MKLAVLMALALVGAPLLSCSSGPPSAPLGLDRHPANSAATLASLRALGQQVPVPSPPPPPMVAVAPPIPPDPPYFPNERPTPSRITVFVVSDFSAPRGIASLSPQKRAELITAATQAQSVTLLCRGDQSRPSRAYRVTLIQRGIEIKKFLVSQGVAPGRIRLLARSAGAFVADNATREGRAQNRRVEIHLV